MIYLPYPPAYQKTYHSTTPLPSVDVSTPLRQRSRCVCEGRVMHGVGLYHHTQISSPTRHHSKVFLSNCFQGTWVGVTKRTSRLETASLVGAGAYQDIPVVKLLCRGLRVVCMVDMQWCRSWPWTFGWGGVGGAWTRKYGHGHDRSKTDPSPVRSEYLGEFQVEADGG